jgi:uncharacterized protein YjbJ (UPF0337 family)
VSSGVGPILRIATVLHRAFPAIARRRWRSVGKILIANDLCSGMRVAVRYSWSGDRRPAVNAKELCMNWDRIEGNWKQVKGKIKENWGKLTDDDLDVIGGKRDQLIGKIQQQYGISKDEAERQVDRFGGSLRDDDFRRYQ